MEDDWEAVADAEVVIHPKVTQNVNKWEGEDDDEDVKDSWEDEEEKKDEEKAISTSAPAKVKPNKAVQAKLAEQARLDEEEEERRLANMTAEEKLAEKLRMQKIQEESDLKSALDTFGVSQLPSTGLDAYSPKSKEEFQEFGAAVCWKVSQFKESAHYPTLVEEMVRNVCLHLTVADIKKVKIAVEALHSEKLKMEKQNAKKANSKAKGKATLQTETDDIDVYKKYGDDYANDYDDFM